jgi:AcrR family transcriptional regulator
MRMVAKELGVSPMAAYRHVPNREALVALVADELMASVPVPPRNAGPWDIRLRELECSAFRAAASVPGQSDVTVLASSPHQRRLADGVMAILTDAGFGEEDAAVAFEVIWAYFQGQLRIYERLTTPAAPAAVAPAAAASAAAALDHGATPALWPSLAQVIAGVPSLSPVDFFERGFETLLDGLRTRLAAKPR